MTTEDNPCETRELSLLAVSVFLPQSFDDSSLMHALGLSKVWSVYLSRNERINFVCHRESLKNLVEQVYLQSQYFFSGPSDHSLPFPKPSSVDCY